MGKVMIGLPELIVKRVRELGMDLESMVIELLLKELKLDPSDQVKVHLELARKFLEEGARLADSDPVQASEELYKVVEECVKALTIHFELKDVLEKVERKGRWTVVELEKAVEAISDRVGLWFYDAWDHAWALHVWGFHEAKLDSMAVKRRLESIAKMVKETEKLVLQG
ncbi:MAG: PaREP1 family protein [Candidatus Nezhaarchaeales archaeon]